MNYGLRKLSTRTKLVAAALALAMASVSHAATQVGGGATLPSIGYVGSNAATDLQVWGTSTSNTTGSYIAPTSLFGVYQAQSNNPNVSYCLTGSGAGKDILAGATVSGVEYNVQYACAKNTNGTVTGFGASLAGVNRSTLTQPNFAAADSPVNGSDYLNYQGTHLNSGKTAVTGYPIQFPAVAGAIAISFNLKDSLNNQVKSAEANFSDAQICGILDGEYTTWNQVSSAFTLTDGGSIPATPINVQYRSDGSGTTFSLSNHLTAVCAAFNSKTFQANQAFTSVVASFFSSGLPNGNGTTTPKWTGSSGNESVATAIGNTSNSFGYVETANALATNPGLQFADVNGASPTANFGGPITLANSDVVYNEVINTTNASNGSPQIEEISSLSGVIDPPASTSQCIALVPPADYAKPGKGSLLATGSYPIVGISYLLANTNGNGTDEANTQGVLTSPYNYQASSFGVTTIGPGKGIAFLALPSSGAPFSTTQIKDCFVN